MHTDSRRTVVRRAVASGEGLIVGQLLLYFMRTTNEQRAWAYYVEARACYREVHYMWPAYSGVSRGYNVPYLSRDAGFAITEVQNK